MTKRIGRPPYEPNERDREVVKSMVAAGIPHENIARCIGEGGISAKTLKKYYQHELDTGADVANAQIAQSLYQRALNGDTAAAIWWTKSRMRWAERKEADVNLNANIKMIERKIVKADN